MILLFIRDPNFSPRQLKLGVTIYLLPVSLLRILFFYINKNNSYNFILRLKNKITYSLPKVIVLLPTFLYFGMEKFLIILPIL
ncbi:LOW QUALITY PROTEIN: hypothetical protein PanWU01x14_087760 [Parasponia andersonii]|uniref:Uncharacterized protein n=1 Tax=Parasponia andersonii TaxID=3476 RepID=A0A2P5D8K6_PARAD|nr:LOW QUALITY PROTEIN: hypothetical protein PanWU01x14_087760 [Parasponia andersonii]